MKIQILFLLILFGSTALAAEEYGPAVQLRQIFTSISARLSEQTGAPSPQQDQARIAAVVEELDSHLAMKEAAAHIYGKAWTALSGEQRQRFICHLRPLIQRAVVDQQAEWGNAAVEFLSESVKGEMALVTTAVTVSGRRSSVIYTLIRSRDRWLVYDINIDGAGMLRNFMYQVRSIVQGGGYEAVITELQKREGSNRQECSSGSR